MIKIKDLASDNGFTLFELIVVLAIISAMVTVIVPFASRSNDSLRIREQSRDVAQTIRYAIDLAQNSCRPVKFVINTKNKSYYLEQTGSNEGYELIEAFLGSIRYINKKIHIFDIEGFGLNGEEFFLVFDPRKPWPKAQLSLSTKDLMETVRINAKSVQIEETGI